MPERSVVVASADLLLAEAAGAWLDERPGWRTATVVLDGLAAVAAVARHRPQAVLATDDLPRLGAGTLAVEIGRRWPQVTVVVLGDEPVAGARNLPPRASPDAVLTALAAPPPHRLGAAGAERLDSVVMLGRLTRQERRVLKLVAAGRSPGDIATDLRLSPNTVRTHLQHVYAKLGCHNRAEVVGFAARLGLLGRA